jgi:hypothetical protein
MFSLNRISQSIPIKQEVKSTMQEPERNQGDQNNDPPVEGEEDAAQRNAH